MFSARSFDKLGAIGVLIAVILSPCCFPLFAFIATSLGLGSSGLFGEWAPFIIQLMVLVNILGLLISFFKHWCIYPTLVSVLSGILIFYHYNFTDNDSNVWIYLGMLGLFVATIWNYQRNKMHGTCSSNQEIVLLSTLSCPNCNHKKVEEMPTNACSYFYECENCKAVLKPKEGDCCVYCSYGTVKCPPMQTGEGCC